MYKLQSIALFISHILKKYHLSTFWRSLTIITLPILNLSSLPIFFPNNQFTKNYKIVDT